MSSVLSSLLDAWLRRSWKPDAAALAALPPLAPAVVVTGGSEGIGLALARRFAAARRDVVLIARRPEPLTAAAAAIERDFAVRAVALPLDITRPDAAGMVEQQLARQGLYVDVLVNNAGIGLSGPFTGAAAEDIERLTQLNVAALTRLMRRFLPVMCLRGRGGVLNIASLGGFTPGPYQAAYYASKAYVISLTEAVAWEVRGQGVRLSVLVPGPVNTDFHRRMNSESALYRRILWSLPAERVAQVAYWGFLWGRRIVAPGPLSLFAALAMRIMPHTLLIPMIAVLLKPWENWSHARR